jgi:hypothetical protein
MRYVNIQDVIDAMVHVIKSSVKIRQIKNIDKYHIEEI